MTLDHPCDLCGAEYEGLRAALRCCEERLEALDVEPRVVGDGAGLPTVEVARDQERVSALVDGGWYAVLASVDRNGVHAGDLRVALQEVERELEHLVAIDADPDHEPASRQVRTDGGD